MSVRYDFCVRNSSVFNIDGCAKSCYNSIIPPERFGRKELTDLSESINRIPSVTELGNPRRPQGDAGVLMLNRMNESHAAVTAWGLSFLDAQPQHTVLDIGCGGGAALAKLAETVTEGHLTGLDYSPVSVQTASDTNRAAIEAGRMDIIEGSVSAMPFADGAFDRIITVESSYFWEHPTDDLREVRRVMKETGRFLLIADIYGRDDLPQEARDNIAKYNLYNPTPETFRQLLEDAGFARVQIHLKDGTTWICAEGRGM